MKFIKCMYCGVEYFGIQGNNPYYNLVNSTGGYCGSVPLSSLTDVKELVLSSQGGEEGLSLVGLLGAKPMNITVNF
jgi:hypothetical protein